jgi:hypothetical protein
MLHQATRQTPCVSTEGALTLIDMNNPVATAALRQTGRCVLDGVRVAGPVTYARTVARPATLGPADRADRAGAQDIRFQRTSLPLTGLP